jgi:predicted butyrate kinase (DUF1464 family)
VRADQATARDLRLAFLAPDGEAGGIGGLRRLARLLAESGLPVVYLPGVIHLPSVPEHRKLNRVDLGTADKVAVAALAIWDQARRLGGSPIRTSFLLLELGGAFTAALAVDQGAIVDGIGGSSGPIGWQSSGAWDGEVAFLAGKVGKDLLFQGGAAGSGEAGMAAYVEGALKAALRPVASVYGLIVGTLLSGSFAVEVITAWPGLGKLMLDALRARDVYLVAGCAGAGAIFLAFGTLLSDVALALVDPRARR